MKKTRRLYASDLIMPICIILLLILLLFFPEVSFEYMKSSLKLCAQSLVPSLFPFMIISDFLVMSNSGGILQRLFCKPIGVIFGTSPDGSFAALLGFLCGFPIGAKSALKLYDDGRISHAELCHIMSFCNIPSPAFVCGTVGAIFHSARLGIILFISLVLSSLIIGVICRAIYKYERVTVCSQRISNDCITAFTSSVTSSATVMTCVCAYVVFFSVIIGYTKHLCCAINAPSILSLLCSISLEISNGMAEIAASDIAASGAKNAPLLAAFCAGFSGLSVIFQIISLDKSRQIPKKTFIFQKLIQGLLCCAITFFAIKLFPVELSFSAETIRLFSFENYGIYICILFFISAVLPLLATLAQRNKYQEK